MIRKKYWLFILAILLLIWLPILGWAQVTVSLPADVKGEVDDYAFLPITVGNLTGLNALSYEFTVTYDKNVVEITGYDAVGTLSEGMSIVANTTVPGQVKVAAAGTNALVGSGTLLNLKVKYVGSGSTDLTWEKFMFNEGTPTASPVNGHITVGAIDVILPTLAGDVGNSEIFPITVSDLTGKNVLSYEFTITFDKNVVKITGYDAVGTLSEGMSIVANTTVPGQIKVAAAGTAALSGAGTLLKLNIEYIAEGSSDLTFANFMFNEGTPDKKLTNGKVNIGRIDLILPETKGNIGETGLLPIMVEDLTGKDVLAYEFTVTYDKSVVEITGYDAVGTLSEDMSIVANTTVPGQIKVAAAGTTALVGSGTLLNLKVKYVGSGRTDLTWEKFMFNEGTPSANTINGSVSGNLPPVFVKVMPDTTISEGQALDYTYTATDADGDTLTFSLVNPPVGAKINSTSGVFSWTPSKQIGTYQIIISLTDGIVTVNDTASVHLMVVTPEGNLTLNPEFNDGLNNWTGFASAPGAAAITLDDTYKLSGKYSMRVNVTAQGSNIWDIQRMTPLPIETGYTYNISYYAVADKDNAKVRFVLEMADSPYTAYLDTTIYIMTEPQLFEFVLKKNTVNEPTTMLKWQFGQPGSVPVNIWIDAVFATRVKDVAIKDEPSIPDEFILSQNYPNPFNPTTNITFGLPKESNVTIDVYNLMGQKVATLVNERINAGYHTVNWNGRDASGNRVTSGVYIYKITAGDFAKSKKMLLVK